MGVHDDAFGFAVGYAEDDAGGLAGGTGDGEEFGHGLRDFAVELLGDDAACALNRLGFVVIEAGGTDEFFEGFDWCCGHGCGRGVGGEEFRGDHVDADVGALGAQDGRDEELPGVFVDEGALDVGVGVVEDLQDLSDAGGFDFEFGYAVAGGCGGDGLRGRGAVGWGGLDRKSVV